MTVAVSLQTIHLHRQVRPPRAEQRKHTHPSEKLELEMGPDHG